MGLEAYMWIRDDGTVRPGTDPDHMDPTDPLYGWIELKDYVHKLAPNVKAFDIMWKLHQNTPWLAEKCLKGDVIDRALVHSMSDTNTLTLYELTNIAVVSIESREDDEEQADQVAAAIQTIAANSDKSAPSDEWSVVPLTGYNVEESEDRYELFQVVCSGVKLTYRQRDPTADTNGLISITNAIKNDPVPASGFYTSD